MASIVECLVTEGGANVNTTDEFKRSCLHWACRFNNEALVTTLLSLGIKWQMVDIEGKTAFDICQIYKNNAALETL